MVLLLCQSDLIYFQKGSMSRLAFKQTLTFHSPIHFSLFFLNKRIWEMKNLHLVQFLKIILSFQEHFPHTWLFLPGSSFWMKWQWFLNLFLSVTFLKVIKKYLNFNLLKLNNYFIHSAFSSFALSKSTSVSPPSSFPSASSSYFLIASSCIA